ncbi:30S ribosomal protein S17 [bacterium]|nr:30S ribosomal protein S17 [bacterium]
MTEKISLRKNRIGRVVGDKTDKTVKVETQDIHKHPKYKKYLRTRKTFLVHDPNDECHLGDIVKIEECRPISKCKKWVVREIVERFHGIQEDIRLRKKR